MRQKAQDHEYLQLKKNLPTFTGKAKNYLQEKQSARLLKSTEDAATKKYNDMVIDKNLAFANMEEEKKGIIKEHTDIIAGRDTEIVDLNSAVE